MYHMAGWITDADKGKRFARFIASALERTGL
jgi:hypothetical protein